MMHESESCYLTVNQLIPYVYVPFEDGRSFLSSKIGTMSRVEVDTFGAACYSAWESEMCAKNWPCDDGNYCEFTRVPIVETDLFTEGGCRPCPDDPVACYFDSRQDGLSDTVETITTKTVQRASISLHVRG
jgi:hypothetical protein